ncbi:DNA mismatch repair endonuclease MutL [Trichlorobacter ammonificans]|uniref:DNA mismatch repair protein MutL n=1 Tax=Trichlorobacter ammonificans TaxID=2916410 RepID=A0ABN8HD03_9BACT|nr:DNA mismatch repair endonuclease MutL [Trichlorobacter ammonificans]CAH2030546.1 DNA mismatch repair protein MutL [Trichlorobacter ammonificans]
MPSRIKILSESLANKIAAGEVVERPASVIKELVENALDAGATDIRLEIAAGGRRLIRVSDNGHGMSREDALLALERHATSKLLCDRDLEAISTLGFRGEALPSIASVSRLRLKSRENGAVEGTELYLEGGVVRSVTACGMAVGTEISVEHLFFNTPARLKFLRSAQTEAGHVGDQMVRLAVARPDVAFSYTSDGRELFRVTAGTARQRLQKLVARDAPLFEVAGETAVLSISGFFAPPHAARSTTAAMFTYINGRFVRDKVVQHAVMQAFRPVLERGRYPLLALFIKIPPEEVDVNVHPTKHEVRFRRQHQVHDTIHAVLSEALSRSPWLATGRVPEIAASAVPSPVPAPRTAEPTGHRAGVQQALERFMAAPPSAAPRIHEPPPAYVRPVPTEPPPQTGYFSALTVIGQFQAAYILCQSETALVIIDQHAAAERVRFQELRQRVLAHRIESQRLLIPDTLELSFAEADTARRYHGELGRLGIELEPFGGQTFMLTAVPVLVADTDRVRLVRDLLEELTGLGKSSAFDSVLDDLLSRIACHSVIRGAHPLDRRQMEELLRRMDRTDFAAHCPHGRPVSHELPLSEIGRFFKRT